jgi:hypothetical protein
MEFGELLPYLTRRYCEWISEQHDLHIANSRPLSNEEKSLLGGYFDERILGLTRITTVERMSNPEFYGELAKLGISDPIDFTQAVGFTLADDVLICKYFEHSPSSWISILFHEMVHVVQCDILGLRRLIELYIETWAKNGHQYVSVPFERQAYTLENKFARGEPSFSVRQILERELASEEFLTGG